MTDKTPNKGYGIGDYPSTVNITTTTSIQDAIFSFKNNLTGIYYVPNLKLTCSGCGFVSMKGVKSILSNSTALGAATVLDVSSIHVNALHPSDHQGEQNQPRFFGHLT